MSRDDSLPAETLVCAVSATHRADPGRNEDAWLDVRVPRAGLRPALYGVVVADGLGSYSHAAEAAREVIGEAAEWLRLETEDFGRHLLPRLFAQVHAHLRAHAREAGGGADPEPHTYGTTLLVGLEAGDDLVAGYAGNGAVWHLRGNLDAFPSAGLPWSAVNLLNPHSVPRDGREVLYNLVDAATASPPIPAVVAVRKDRCFGDVLLLCTDGIYSVDQVTHGTDAGGSLWISAEATLVACFHALRDLFAGWDGESELPLEGTLQACLDGLRSQQLLEDDATVGVIVTADALRYHRRAKREHAARAAAGVAGATLPAGFTEREDLAGPASPDDPANFADRADDREEEGCPASPASRA